MVPTHFAVVPGFTFPREKIAIITAEDGVGDERSHRSSRLPVKLIKRTLLMVTCIMIVLPKLNVSLRIAFFLKYCLGS